MTKEEIRDLFATHDLKLSASDVWAVQGTPVVKHAALERLSAKLGLTWDMPREVIASMQDVVILARAVRKDGIAEWSYGEASIVRDGVVGGNYKVSGKQASYVWAMAEKRAKDRVIIKLAGLHGAYSEEEAEDFNRRNADGGQVRDEEPAEKVLEKAPETKSKAANDVSQLSKAETDLRAKIDASETIPAVTDLMLDPATQTILEGLGAERMADMKAYGKARLVALGWPGNRGGQRQAA